MSVEARKLTKEAAKPLRDTAGAQAFAVDTAVVAVAQLLLKLRGLVTLPLIAKMLGTAHYGIWAQALAFVTLIQAIFSGNLHLPLVRFIAGDKADRGRVYSTLLVATLAAAVSGGAIISLFAGSLGHVILGEGGFAPFVHAGVLLMLFGNVRLLNLNVYRATDRLKLRSVVELVTTFGELAGICLLLWRGHSLLQVFLFMIVWEGVIAVLQTWHVFTVVGWGSPRRSILTEALRYALPLFPAVFSIWILDRADRFVIGHYLGPTGVGVYSANYALASLLMLFQTPFQMTLLPKVASLWDTDRDTAAKYISVSNKAFLTLAIPFVIGLPVVSRVILEKLGNAEIAAPSSAVVFLISAGVMLWGVSIIQSQVFHGARKTSAIGMVTLIAAAVNLALNFALVPLFGVSGAALATLISYAGVCIAFYVLGRDVMRLKVYGGYLLKCTAAALVMAAVIYLMSPTRLRGVIAATLAGGGIYFCVLWLLGAFVPSEIEMVRRLFRRALGQSTSA
jgi:O-antigen/teichoic acid export membrane protein